MAIVKSSPASGTDSDLITYLDTRKMIEDALGPVWGWYQPDDQDDRHLGDILQDVSEDLQQDRKAVLAARRLVFKHEDSMKKDVREEDRVQHELNSFRSLLIGLDLVLK